MTAFPYLAVAAKMRERHEPPHNAMLVGEWTTATVLYAMIDALEALGETEGSGV